MKFLPEPMSKYAHKTTPLIFSGMMAGNDRSSEAGLYAVDTVPSIGQFNERLSHKLVWCFDLHLKLETGATSAVIRSMTLTTTVVAQFLLVKELPSFFYGVENFTGFPPVFTLTV